MWEQTGNVYDPEAFATGNSWQKTKDDPTPSWLVDAAIRGEISPLTKKEGREWKRGEQFEGNEDSRLAMKELRKYMTGR